MWDRGSIYITSPAISNTPMAHRIRFNEFSALCHSVVEILRTFVLCVLGCKWNPYVGTIQKTISRQPGN
jgi:hypothetical protein